MFILPYRLRSKVGRLLVLDGVRVAGDVRTRVRERGRRGGHRGRRRRRRRHCAGRHTHVLAASTCRPNIRHTRSVYSQR